MNPNNSENRFIDLVAAHEAMIHKICRIYAGSGGSYQDLFQEIIIQLWKSFERYRGESAFSTWMYRVAINTAISAYRKEKQQPKTFSLHNLQAEIAESNESRYTHLQVKELYEAIELLNPIEKGIVLLYLEDKSYDEMEEILGIASGTLRVRMTRIREKLRTINKAL